ncbi:M48 family metalloprotease [Lentisphaerota bacterium ZTH]|nr:hypothetical protein JYG24_05655 [Lentisphaerota bacterium]WET07011.1 M48 family metalloprotease [Lentisphaerota bacterium ZTH]
MKYLFIFLALLAVPFLAVSGQVNLGDRCKLQTVNAEKGRELLTKNDVYLQRLTSFERAARLRLKRPVSAAEFKSYIRHSVKDWTPAEEKIILAALARCSSKLKNYYHLLPENIYVIRTSGQEECNTTGYTRGKAIILSDTIFKQSRQEVEFLLMHELFHIITRHNPGIREPLYALIGFKKCIEPSLPAALEKRRITNPDALYNDYAIKVLRNKCHYWVVPRLYISHTFVSPATQGRLFDYINMVFVVVSKGDTAKPGQISCEPYLMGMGEVSGFFEQVGRNTFYVIHPEEILADNFALMIVGHVENKKIVNRNLISKISAVMSAWKPAGN